MCLNILHDGYLVTMAMKGPKEAAVTERTMAPKERRWTGLKLLHRKDPSGEDRPGRRQVI